MEQDDWIPDNALEVRSVVVLESPYVDPDLKVSRVSGSTLQPYLETLCWRAAPDAAAQSDPAFEVAALVDENRLPSTLLRVGNEINPFEETRAALFELSIARPLNSFGEALSHALADLTEDGVTAFFDVATEAELEVLQQALWELAKDPEAQRDPETALQKRLKTAQNNVAAHVSETLQSPEYQAAENVVQSLRRVLDTDDASCFVAPLPPTELATHLDVKDKHATLALREGDCWSQLGGQLPTLYAVTSLIGSTAHDLAKLEACVDFAETYDAPMALSVLPGLYGLESFADLDDMSDPVGYLRQHEPGALTAMRQRPASRYLALVAQQTPARTRLNAIEDSPLQAPFREDANITPVWISGALSLMRTVQEAGARTGWVGDLVPSTEGGACRSFVDSLGRVQIGTPVRHVYSEQSARALAEVGLVPVRSIDGQLVFDAMPSTFSAESGIPHAFGFVEVLAERQFGAFVATYARDRGFGKFRSPISALEDLKMTLQERGAGDAPYKIDSIAGSFEENGIKVGCSLRVSVAPASVQVTLTNPLFRVWQGI